MTNPGPAISTRSRCGDGAGLRARPGSAPRRSSGLAPTVLSAPARPAWPSRRGRAAWAARARSRPAGSGRPAVRERSLDGRGRGRRGSCRRVKGTRVSKNRRPCRHFTRTRAARLSCAGQRGRRSSMEQRPSGWWPLRAYQGGHRAAAVGSRARLGGDPSGRTSRAGTDPQLARARDVARGTEADACASSERSRAGRRDHRLGHRAHLPRARRARRAVRARRRRRRARGAGPRPPGVLRRPPAARRRRRGAARRAARASTPSPRSRTTASTAR